jgi:hypothetical protein
MISRFIWARSLLADFARVHSRNLCVFLISDSFTGVLLRCSSGGTGTNLSTWAMEEAVILGATLSGRGGAGDVRLEDASIDAAGIGAVPVPLAVGWSVPLGLVGAVG